MWLVAIINLRYHLTKYQHTAMISTRTYLISNSSCKCIFCMLMLSSARVMAKRCWRMENGIELTPCFYFFLCLRKIRFAQYKVFKQLLCSSCIVVGCCCFRWCYWCCFCCDVVSVLDSAVCHPSCCSYCCCCCWCYFYSRFCCYGHRRRWCRCCLCCCCYFYCCCCCNYG